MDRQMSKDKKYIVILRANASVRIKDTEGVAEVSFRGKNSDYKLTISDQFQEIQNVKIHSFLQIEFELNHTDIEQAILEAVNFSNFILSLFCFVSSAEVSPAKVHIAYDITSDSTDREHVQYVYLDTIPISNKRNIKYENFDMIFNSFLKHHRSDRIGRAIIWYRKSLKETDDVGKFSALWIGFEALNPLLASKLDSQKDKYRCISCGHETNKNSAIGIKDFIMRDLEEGDTIYKDLSTMRNSIVHSSKNLVDINNDAKNLLPKFYKVFKEAVLFLLDINYRLDEDWFVNDLTSTPNFYIKHKCIIHQKDLIKLKINNLHPHFNGGIEITDAGTKPNGDKSFTLQNKLVPVFNGGYTTVVVETWGNEKHGRLDIISQD